MDDLAGFCCQNAACADRSKRGAGNLTVRMRYGKDKHLRLLYCRTCHARFSERKGTPLFQARLPEAKVEAVLAHSAEGGGVRKTGRLGGGEPRDCSALLGACGRPCPSLARRLGRGFPPRPAKYSSTKSGLS